MKKPKKSAAQRTGWWYAWHPVIVLSYDGQDIEENFVWFKKVWRVGEVDDKGRATDMYFDDSRSANAMLHGCKIQKWKEEKRESA